MLPLGKEALFPSNPEFFERSHLQKQHEEYMPQQQGDPLPSEDSLPSREILIKQVLEPTILITIRTMLTVTLEQLTAFFKSTT